MKRASHGARQSMVPTLADAPLAADTDRQRLLDEAHASRAHAAAVLEGLLAAKAECERELVKSRRSDPFKAVTGKSSLDRAIASTRKMIDSLDRMIERSGAEVVVTIGR